ncbi:hypothetical protein ACFL5P_00370, partial [candidate division KSB1 bacterium]
EQLIRTLHYDMNKNAWATQASIVRRVNRDGGQRLHENTIYQDLQNLIRKNIISSERDQVMRRRFVYAINVLSPGSVIQFPHPSDIVDMVYNGLRVRVINPITGVEEEI